MKAAILAGLIALSACATPVPSNQAYALAAALAAADGAALSYMALPTADPLIKAKIKQSEMIAYSAVKSAESGDSTAAIAAQSAIAALITTIPKGTP